MSATLRFGGRKSKPALPKIAIETRTQKTPEKMGNNINSVSDLNTAKLSEMSSQVRAIRLTRAFLSWRSSLGRTGRRDYPQVNIAPTALQMTSPKEACISAGSWGGGG